MVEIRCVSRLTTVQHTEQHFSTCICQRFEASSQKKTYYWTIVDKKANYAVSQIMNIVICIYIHLRVDIGRFLQKWNCQRRTPSYSETCIVSKHKKFSFSSLDINNYCIYAVSCCMALYNFEHHMNANNIEQRFFRRSFYLFDIVYKNYRSTIQNAEFGLKAHIDPVFATLTDGRNGWESLRPSKPTAVSLARECRLWPKFFSRFDTWRWIFTCRTSYRIVKVWVVQHSNDARHDSVCIETDKYAL